MKDLLDTAIYDDLLNMFMRFFLEFGIASFITFQAPWNNVDVDMPNIMITTFVIIGIFLGIPYVYYFIY